ncbi:MAG: hypothetical protein WDZ49_16690 [Litorilinea sp.]
MNHKSSLWALVALFVATMLSACTGIVAIEPQPQVMALEAFTHLALGMAEQDVFIERVAGSGQVERIIPGEEADMMRLPIYAAGELVEHDLFGTGENPLGPYANGMALGMTLGEWLSATGHGSYTVTGERAKIELTFEKLVPNGIYTAWCSRVSFPPNIEVVDIACGAADGSENVFMADAEGNAHFELELAALPPSSPETVSTIAIAYHSDGNTYGPYPGDFGLNSHVHLAAPLAVIE